jgi:hypothetical protein
MSILPIRGIRYFDAAINETRALGVRPRPALFRWTRPRGGSVLFWHSNGYLFGNAIGAAYVFGGGLRLGQPGAEERVGKFLKGLEEGGQSDIRFRGYREVSKGFVHGERNDAYREQNVNRNGLRAMLSLCEPQPNVSRKEESSCRCMNRASTPKTALK